MCNVRAADVPQTNFMKSLKDSHGMSTWVGIIIPSVLAFISMETVIRANQDKPEHNDIVSVAKYLRWMSLLTAAFFVDKWYNIDFKEFASSYWKK